MENINQGGRNNEGGKEFSVVARGRSLAHAWRGVGLFLRTTHNAWVQIFFGALAVGLGFVLEISSTEWLAITFAIGLVLVTEAMNTAIEIHMDLTSPDPHPHARDTKDVAAGAVLISVMVSVVVGLIVFLPKILPYFS